MATTANYGWDIGFRGKNPWWDTWVEMWQNVDTKLFQKTGGYISASEYATLQLANTAAYNAGKTLLISSNWTLTANTTLTAAVKVIKGGTFTKASTYTLTINGPFEAGNYQVFFGFDPGDIIFGPGAIKEAFAEWGGTKPNDETIDCALGINLMLNAGCGVQLMGGSLIGTRAIYYISTKISLDNSKFLRGAGRGATIIKANAVGITMVDSEDSNYTEMAHLTLDGDNKASIGRNLEGTTGYAIFNQMNIVAINNCTDTQLYGKKVSSNTFSNILLSGGAHSLKLISGEQNKLDNLVLSDSTTSTFYIENIGNSAFKNFYIYSDVGMTGAPLLFHIVNSFHNHYDNWIIEDVKNTGGTENGLIEYDSTKEGAGGAPSWIQPVENVFDKCNWNGLADVNHIRITSNDSGNWMFAKTKFIDCEFINVTGKVDINIVHAQDTYIQNSFRITTYWGAQTTIPTVTNASAYRVYYNYAEGTWTPRIAFGGGTTGITYNGVTAGHYTRMGRMVFFSAWIVLTSKGSSVGAAIITGLPFTSYNSTALGSISLRMSGITFADFPQAYIAGNNTIIYLSESTNAGVTTDLADTNFVDTSSIMISGSYLAQ